MRKRQKFQLILKNNGKISKIYLRIKFHYIKNGCSSILVIDFLWSGFLSKQHSMKSLH